MASGGHLTSLRHTAGTRPESAIPPTSPPRIRRGCFGIQGLAGSAPEGVWAVPRNQASASSVRAAWHGPCAVVRHSRREVVRDRAWPRPLPSPPTTERANSTKSEAGRYDLPMHSSEIPARTRWRAVRIYSPAAGAAAPSPPQVSASHNRAVHCEAPEAGFGMWSPGGRPRRRHPGRPLHPVSHQPEL